MKYMAVLHYQNRNQSENAVKYLWILHIFDFTTHLQLNLKIMWEQKK